MITYRKRIGEKRIGEKRKEREEREAALKIKRSNTN